MPELYQGRGSSKNRFELFDAPKVIFSGKSTAVWYQVEERPAVLSERGLSMSGLNQYMLKIITFDVLTGAEISTTETATYPDGQLFPAKAGLVLRTRNVVRFLSKTGDRVLEDVSLPDARKDPSAFVFVRVSRDGKDILVDYRYRKVNIEGTECEYSGEDFALIRPCGSPKHPLNRNDYNWYLDFRLNPPIAGTGNGWPYLNKNERMYQLQMSTDYSVGAAIIAKTVDAIQSWDIYGHETDRRMVVFNAKTGATILTVPFDLKGHEPFSVELAPDGRWVILLKGKRLSLYAVNR